MESDGIRVVVLEHGTAATPIAVGAPIPSTILMVGRASLDHQSDDWREFLRWGADPLSRLGANWPRQNDLAREVMLGIRDDVEAAAAFYEAVVALGRRAIGMLSAPEQSCIMEALAPKDAFHSVARLAGQREPIHCVNSVMPINYSLPFVERGELLVRMPERRLIGLTFKASPDGTWRDT